jgi:hypothetical protein
MKLLSLLVATKRLSALKETRLYWLSVLFEKTRSQMISGMQWIYSKESSETVANFSLSLLKAMSVILPQWVFIGSPISS